MSQNISYTNTNFGKNDWLYWPSFLMLIGPFFASILFLIMALKSEYGILERLIMLLGFVFFLSIVIKGFVVFKLSLKTASKVIVVNDGGIRLITYPGSTHFLTSVSVVEDVTDQFTKKHYQVLFPLGCCVFKIVSGDKEYYLPVNKANIVFLESLRGRRERAD